MGIEDELAEVLSRHAARIMKIPCVTSVGVGLHLGQPRIVVTITQSVQGERVSPPEAIPDDLEGHPVVVRTAPPLRVLEPGAGRR